MDSGTSQIYLPEAMANAIAAKYDPPAVFNDTIGAYSIPCDAIPPAFAVKIGGVVFPIDPRDMVLETYLGSGSCMTGTADGLDYAPHVMGTPFMMNALVVFDVGAGQLKLRSR